MNAEDLLFYGSYAYSLDEACEELAKRVISIIGEEESGIPAYEHVKCRVKDSRSAIVKLEKLGCSPNADEALVHLSDVIGVRVIARFIGDVYCIAEALKRSTDIEIVDVQDYIVSPKESGYRSLHLETRVPFPDKDDFQVRAEIQLRTIAMDCWASLEHQLRYKKDVPNAPLVAEELRRCADEMASTDLSMQTIKKMIEKER